MGQLVPLVDGGANGHCIRLNKYAIAPTRSTVQLDMYSPLLLYVADQLEQISRAHATRYFILVDEEGRRDMAVLWLFQPMFSVSLSQSASSIKTATGYDYASGDAVVLLASKVLFTNSSTTSLPTGVQDAEPIHLPHRACVELLAALRAANEMYPPSRRKFGDKWNIGWIPRCPGEDVE